MVKHETKYDGTTGLSPAQIRRAEDCMTPDELDAYLAKIQRQIIRRDWVFYSLVIFFTLAFVAFVLTFVTGCTSTPAVNHNTASMVKTAGNTAEYMEFWARH